MNKSKQPQPNWFQRFLKFSFLKFIGFTKPINETENEPQPVINNEIERLRATIQQLTAENEALKAKATQVSSQHSDLHLQLDKLREENQSLTQRLAKSNTRSYDGNTRNLLELVQLIDVHANSFGKECAAFLHKELNFSLETCGLEFRDYSDEDSDSYSVEPISVVSTIEYGKRAIVVRSKGTTVCTGHVFVPINKK